MLFCSYPLLVADNSHHQSFPQEVTSLNDSSTFAIRRIRISCSYRIKVWRFLLCNEKKLRATPILFGFRKLYHSQNVHKLNQKQCLALDHNTMLICECLSQEGH